MTVPIRVLAGTPHAAQTAAKGGGQRAIQIGEAAQVPLEVSSRHRPQVGGQVRQQSEAEGRQEVIITRADILALLETVRRGHRMIEAALDRLCAG